MTVVRPAAGLALGVLCACAKIEPPPGGPPDIAPPVLVSTVPESAAVVPRFSGDAEFRFDEVISEGGSPNQGIGTGGLERLVVLSPDTLVPDVSWHRSWIGVKPRKGWVPNRVYRIELLPGVTDLRNNRSTVTKVVTFTTGAPLPTFSIAGRVYDWTTSQPARGALISAVLLPDSLPYRMQTDSAGRFDLHPIPAGSYLVYGVIDQNHDLRRGPREAFDTATADSSHAVLELWTFPHDTAGPRIQSIAVRDSLTAVVTFNQPLLPGQHPDSAGVRLLILPDSVPVSVVSLLPPALDSAAHPAAAPADTAGIKAPAPRDSGVKRDTSIKRDTSAARDTTAVPELPAQPKRPPLATTMVLRVALPWRPDSTYLLEAPAIRNANGAAADVKGTLHVPPRPAPDTSHVRSPADSAADSTRADSTHADSARTDSARRARPNTDSLPRTKPAAPVRKPIGPT